jgi:hypothetical protein
LFFFAFRMIEFKSLILMAWPCSSGGFRAAVWLTANLSISTLRRSLGAILKRSLALQAIPRAPGPSESNCHNYCFLADGEARLTEWMVEHLEVGVFASSKYEQLEKFLTREFRPLLNLQGCPNPHRAEIKELRKACADEARQARHARARSA